jgi:adenosylmethionine-8-amino-7-oxononanoate aminotransferase
VSQLVNAEAPINQSVERAVRLLGFFSPEEPELSLAQLTQRLGTSKATTHRYTLALRRVGLLRFEPSAGVYSLGPRIVELEAHRDAAPVADGARAKGVNVRASVQKIVMSPPLVIEDAQADRIVDVLLEELGSL